MFVILSRQGLTGTPSGRVKRGNSVLCAASIGLNCPFQSRFRQYIPQSGRKLHTLALARVPCFATFARWGGTTPPGDRPLIVVELRGKKRSMRLDEISRMHILFVVLGQYLTSLGSLSDSESPFRTPRVGGGGAYPPKSFAYV